MIADARSGPAAVTLRPNASAAFVVLRLEYESAGVRGAVREIRRAVPEPGPHVAVEDDVGARGPRNQLLGAIGGQRDVDRRVGGHHRRRRIVPATAGEEQNGEQGAPAHSDTK